MKRIIIHWALVFITPILLHGQNCGLEDTLAINANSLQTFTFEVTDIFTDDLSNPEQGVCGIEINFTHQFSEDLELWVISPGGDSVQLFGPNTDDPLAFTFFANWDLLFVPCLETAEPDSGYVATWNNDQPNNFIPGGFYDGSYYPYGGCLEQFDSGPANGEWTILVQNNPSPYTGGIFDFRIIFCDARGQDCCFANAGILPDSLDLVTCVGDSQLIFDIEPLYIGRPPDTLVYGYTYAIGQDGVLIEYDSLLDLTDLPVGNYQVCGLSYDLMDLTILPEPDGVLTLDEIYEDVNSLEPSFCGNFVDTCFEVTILPVPEPFGLNQTICEGDTLMVGDSLLTEAGFFVIDVESFAGCDSVVLVNLNIQEIQTVDLMTTICEGDSVVVGSTAYYDAGSYSDTLQTLDVGCDSIVNLELEVLQPVTEVVEATICAGEIFQVGLDTFEIEGNFMVNLLSSQGCDSIVDLQLTVIDLAIDISFPDTINCFNEGITLDGSGSTPAADISFNWTDQDGNSLGSNSTLEVDEAGWYFLEIERSDNAILCTRIDSVFVIDNRIFPSADAGLPDSLTCSTTELEIGGPGTSVGTEFEYEWSSSTTGGFVGATDTLLSTVNSAGEYTLLVTNTLNGCTASDIVTISIDTLLPTVEAGPPMVLTCQEPQVTLDGSGSDNGVPFELEWSFEDGAFPGDSLLINPTVNATGTYLLTVSNSLNNCVALDSVEITENIDLPNIELAPTDLLNCETTSLVLDGSGSDEGFPFEIIWETSEGGNIDEGANTLMPTIDAPGIYELLIINQETGCRDSLSITVQDTINTIIADTGPIAELTCTVDTLILDGSASTNNPDIVYEWTTTAGNIIEGNDSTHIQIDAPGLYILSVTDTVTRCSDIDSILIETNTDFPTADAGLTQELTCTVQQDTLDGTDSSVGPEFSYAWDGPCVLEGENTLTPIIDCPGTYTLTVTNTVNECVAVDEVIITQNESVPIAEVVLADTLNCLVNTIELDGTGSSIGDSIVYEWTGPGLVGDTDQLMAMADLNGIYTLVVTNTNSNCSASEQVEVVNDTIHPIADPGPGGVITCIDTIINLGGSGSTTGAAFEYEWFSNQGTISGPTDSIFTFVEIPSVYGLVVTNTINGCADTALTIVSIDTLPPFADAGPDMELSCAASEVMLDGSGSSAGNTIAYLWEGPCLTSAADANIVGADCPGVFILTVTDEENGCIDTSIANVFIEPLTPSAILPDVVELSCLDGTVALDGSASSGGTTEWFFENDIIAEFDDIITVADTGVYTLVITSGILGCTDSASVLVTIDCDPQIIFATPDTITCDAPLVNLDASATTGGGAVLNFQWQGPTDNCIIGPADIPNPTAICSGIYTLVVENPVLNLFDTLSIEVNANEDLPDAVATALDTLTCDNLTAELDAFGSSVGTGIVYVWTNEFTGDTLGQEMQVVVDAPGNYFLEVIDTISGCMAVDFVNVVQTTVQPEIFFGSPIIPCLEDTFVLQAFVEPPNSNYDFTWSGPGILTNADSLGVTIDSSGTYIFSVVDTQNNCTATDSIVVEEQSCIPCLNILPPDTLTCSSSITNITANFCEPCVGCEVVWDTDDGIIDEVVDSLTIMVTDGGTYTVIATDTLGFSIELDVEVFLETGFTEVSAGADQLITCRDSVITLESTVISSTDSLVYSWSSENNTPIVPNDIPNPEVTEPDIYYLEVFNSITGCTIRDTVNIATNFETPIANAGVTQELTCTETNVILDGSDSDFGANITYAWTAEGNPNIGGANTVMPIVNSPGWYVLTVQDTLNGCFSIDSVLVTQDDALPFIPTLPDTNLNCAVEEILLVGEVPNTTGFTFEWCQLDGETPIGCENELSFLVDAPGTYSFEVINDTTGCSNQIEVVVGLDLMPPIIEAGASDTLACDVDSLALNGTAQPNNVPLDISWMALGNTPIQDSTTLSPTIFFPDTFILTVINEINHCSASDTVAIFQDLREPEVEAGVDTMLTCSENQLFLSGTGETISGAIEFIWNTNNGNIIGDTNQQQVPINEPGVYYLTVLDPQNNCTASDSVVVSGAVDQPVIALADTSSLFLSCSRDTVLLDASASISTTGSELGYLWSIDGTGNIIGPTDQSSIQVDEIGFYQLVVEDLDNGCTDTLMLQIPANIELPSVVIAAPQDITCDRLSVILNGAASSEGTVFEHQWSYEEELILPDTSLTIEVGEAGMYTLTIINQDNGCVDSATIEVGLDTISPIAFIETPAPLDCIERETILDGSLSSSGNTIFYQWTTSNGEIIGAANEIAAIAGTVGDYNLNVLNTRNGCEASALASVIEISNPITGATVLVDPPSCIGDKNAQIFIDSVIGGTAPYQFALDSEVFIDQQVFNNLAPGPHQLIIRDANNCRWEDTLNVDLPLEPQLDLGLDIEVQLGDSVELEALVNFDSIRWLSWFPVEAFEDPAQLIQVVTPIETSTYTVKALDENGCEAQDRITVTVLERDPIFLPTAFSPNGDGTNDIFYIFARPEVRMINSFMIFDRWGNNVYAQEMFQPNDPTYGWDGHFNGQIMNNAVFVYFVELELMNGTKLVVKGDVVLAK